MSLAALKSRLRWATAFLAQGLKLTEVVVVLLWGTMLPESSIYIVQTVGPPLHPNVSNIYRGLPVDLLPHSG